MKKHMLVAIASVALPLSLAALFIMHPPRMKGEGANGTEISRPPVNSPTNCVPLATSSIL